MVDEVARPLAHNLRRLRIAAGLTVIELARRSGTARATLTQLEAGGGNPTLETLYALANQLGAPLADLLADPARPPARLVRRGSGPRVAGHVVEAWLLHQHRRGDQSLEVYSITMHGRSRHISEPHPGGTREHLHLHAGRVRVGPHDAPVDLDAGDYADYPADHPHVYQRLTAATVAATLVITSRATG